MRYGNRRTAAARRDASTAWEPPFRLGFCTYNQPDFPDVAATGARYIRTDDPNATKVAQIRAVGCEPIAIARYTLGTITNQATADAWAAAKLAQWTSLPSPPTVIECLNEPWNASFSDFTTNYALYMQILNTFTRQAWALWPSVRILVCGDTGPTAGWLDAVLAADTQKLYADPRIRPSVHVYCENRTPDNTSGQGQFNFGRYSLTYSKLRAFGHPNPKCWITEFGWESNTAGSVAAGLTVTEQEQSDNVIRGLDLLRTSGIAEVGCVFGMMQGTTPAYNVKRTDNSKKPVVAALTSYAYGKL